MDSQMNSQKENLEQDEKKRSRCCSGWHGHFWLKIIGLAAILIIIAAFVSLFARVHRFGKFEREGGPGYPMIENYGYKTVKPVMFGRLGLNRENGKNSSQIFGKITKIEGNKITVSDNGGKDQAIFSQSNTNIIASGTEISIQDLKPGQNINALGTLNKDNTLAAQIIQVE